MRNRKKPKPIGRVFFTRHLPRFTPSLVKQENVVNPKASIRKYNYGEKFCTTSMAAIHTEAYKDEYVDRFGGYLLRTTNSEKLQMFCIHVMEHLFKPTNPSRIQCQTRSMIVTGNVVPDRKVFILF